MKNLVFGGVALLLAGCSSQPGGPASMSLIGFDAGNQASAVGGGGQETVGSAGGAGMAGSGGMAVSMAGSVGQTAMGGSGGNSGGSGGAKPALPAQCTEAHPCGCSAGTATNGDGAVLCDPNGTTVTFNYADSSVDLTNATIGIVAGLINNQIPNVVDFCVQNEMPNICVLKINAAESCINGHLTFGNVQAVWNCYK